MLNLLNLLASGVPRALCIGSSGASLMVSVLGSLADLLLNLSPLCGHLSSHLPVIIQVLVTASVSWHTLLFSAAGLCAAVIPYSLISSGVLVPGSSFTTTQSSV